MLTLAAPAVLLPAGCRSGAPFGADAGAGQRAGVLMAGTDASTPWIVRAGTRPGPHVMIVGGMHGNEPAGTLAATEIASWDVGRGRLVVVPRANRLALEARERRTPGVAEDEGNLNRNFPLPRSGALADGTDVGAADPVTRGDLAAALWELVERTRPDWLLDLHEGTGFHREDKETVGSSVIACDDERTREVARGLIAVADATVTGFGDLEQRGFDLLKNPVAGSLARAAWERHGIRSMILETTISGWRLSFRARQQRAMVHAFLTELGMEPSARDRLLPVRAGEDRGGLRVAVFDGGGTSQGAARRMVELLEEDPALLVRSVGSPDIRAGVLDQFDVVLHPGGTGRGQARALGEAGRVAEVEFVRGGGGFLGVCAGAYLAACNYDWSLALLDAQVIDREHWKRGDALVDVDLTPAGRDLLGAPTPETAEPDAPFGMRYINGPLVAPGERSDIPDYQTLLLFRGDVAQNGAPAGVMPGTPAAIAGPFGAGRALAFSPHPEKTDGCAGFLLRAVRWLARRTPSPD